jgi:hypothetical protein
MRDHNTPESRARLREERKAPVHKTQLSERQEQSIRGDKEDGIGVEILARRFGVSEQRIREVCSRKS